MPEFCWGCRVWQLIGRPNCIQFPYTNVILYQTQFDYTPNMVRVRYWICSRSKGCGMMAIGNVSTNQWRQWPFTGAHAKVTTRKPSGLPCLVAAGGTTVFAILPSEIACHDEIGCVWMYLASVKLNIQTWYCNISCLTRKEWLKQAANQPQSTLWIRNISHIENVQPKFPRANQII